MPTDRDQPAGRAPGPDAPIRDAFAAAASDLSAVAESAYPDTVLRAVDILEHSFSAGGKLLVFGNGGSSADAQHLAAELVGRFARDRAPLPAIALTTNQALLTAWSNDYRFDDIFARQIEALARPRDVAMAISTSGNSPNVLRGLATAKALHLTTIGLGGGTGGAMAEHCDLLLLAPGSQTPRIQQVHLATYHVICAEIERRLFG